MSRNWTQLSKTVARALRHEPWLYELELDAAGWVDLDELVAALRRQPRWRDLARADLAEVVRRSEKQRYEIDGDRIRALYGHSLSGRIARQPAVPPEVLYHGTAAGSVAVILRDGLRPMRRQYVHLSGDRQTAVTVGRRKGSEVVVLVIGAGAAHRAGVRFLVGNRSVWLAEYIPADYIHAEAGPPVPA